MKLRRRRVKAYEEVEYTPLTVRELLTEMKDISELMTDLAYSALVLDSDPIGEEVEALARRMDWLKYQLRLTASLSVRTVDEAEQVAGIIQVADASEHIANAAEKMVELLDQNVELKPFLSRVLNEADDRIATLKIPADSRVIGDTLGGLDVASHTGMRVLAIRRGKGWIYGPGATTMLQEADVLVLRGQLEGAQHLRDFVHGEVDEL